MNTQKTTLTRWYVSPKDKDTNNSITYAVDGDTWRSVGKLKVTLMDGTIKELWLWEVNRDTINALQDNEDAKGKFIVFSQVNNGAIREFDMKKAHRIADRRRRESRIMPLMTKA